LKTDNKVDLVGTDDRAPLLSWRPAGAEQSAYEIRASRSTDALRKGRADVRRTGKVASVASDSSARSRVARSREAKLADLDETGLRSEEYGPLRLRGQPHPVLLGVPGAGGTLSSSSPEKGG
jgi:hypothetical protein